MKKIGMTLVLLLLSNNAFAALGCMDNSYHMAPDNYYQRLPEYLGVQTSNKANVLPTDYKAYHYVECSCPCELYRKTERRGMCIKCWHYGDPLRSSTLEDKQPNEAGNVALLKKIVEKRKRG